MDHRHPLGTLRGGGWQPDPQPGESRLNKYKKDQVLSKMFDMFLDAVEPEIIEDVVHSCDFDSVKAIEILISVSSNGTPVSNSVPSRAETVAESTSGNVPSFDTMCTAHADDVIVEKEGEVKISGDIDTSPSSHKTNTLVSPKISCRENPIMPLSENFKSTCLPLSKTAVTSAFKSNPPSTNGLISERFSNPMVNIRWYIDNGMKILIFMRGCPGSGKSFLAKNIIQSINGNPKDQIFSTDDFFIVNGKHYFRPDRLVDAHHWNQKRVLNTLRDGISPVIVDNTHTQIWEMHTYVIMALTNGYAVEILEPQTSWIFNEKELFKRNKHGVPLDKIQLMLHRYEHNITVEDLLERARNNGITYGMKPPQIASKPVGVKNNCSTNCSSNNGNMGIEPFRIQTLWKTGAIKKEHAWCFREPAYNKAEEKELSLTHIIKNTDKTEADIVINGTDSFPTQAGYFKSVDVPVNPIGSAKGFKGHVPVTLPNNYLSKDLEHRSTDPKVSESYVGNQTNYLSTLLMSSSLASAKSDDSGMIATAEKAERIQSPKDKDRVSNDEHRHSALERIDFPVTLKEFDLYISSEDEELCDSKQVETVSFKDHCDPHNAQAEEARAADPERSAILPTNVTLSINSILAEALVQLENLPQTDNEWMSPSQIEVPNTEEEGNKPDVASEVLGSSARGEMLKCDLTGLDCKEIVVHVEKGNALHSSSGAPDDVLLDPEYVSSSACSELGLVEPPLKPNNDISACCPTDGEGTLSGGSALRAKEDSWRAALGSDAICDKWAETVGTWEGSRNEKEKGPNGANEPKPPRNLKRVEASPALVESNASVKEWSDSSGWIFSENSAISWETYDKNHESFYRQMSPNSDVDARSQRLKFHLSKSEKDKFCDKETMTCHSDFLVAGRASTAMFEESGLKVIDGQDRDINNGMVNVVKKSHLKLMLDKGTSIDSDSFCMEEVNEDKLEELCRLFANVPVASLRELLDRCHGDVNWVSNLLLDTDNNIFNSTFSQELNDDQQLQTGSGTTSNDVQTKLLTGASRAKSVKLSHRGIHSPQSEEMKEKAIEIKKHLENSIVISNDNYSPHLLTIRDFRKGLREGAIPKYESHRSDFSQGLSAAEVNTVDEDVPILETMPSEEGSEEDESEELLELIFSQDLIQQLLDRFGGADNPSLRQRSPLLKIPVGLARHIHSYLITSHENEGDSENLAEKQQCEEDERIARQLHEDMLQSELPTESTTPQLQEIMDMQMAQAIYQADLNALYRTSEETMATVLAKRLLQDHFPNMDSKVLQNMLQAHNYSFEETVKVLRQSLISDEALSNDSVRGESVKELTDQAKNTSLPSAARTTIPALSADLSDDDYTHEGAMSDANHYRAEAVLFQQHRRECYEKARDAFHRKERTVAAYYSQLAKLHQKKIEQANARAAASVVAASVMSRSPDTMDLHNLRVAEAVIIFDLFLDHHIISSSNSNQGKESLFVITGRGARSADGKSHIKPAVIRRIKERQLQYQEENPGLLKVFISKHSLLSSLEAK